MGERPVRIGKELRKGAPAWMADYPDDTPIELDLGAVRELMERLDKPTKRLDIITDAVRGHDACVEAHQELIKSHEQRLSKLEQADDCDACQEQIDELRRMISDKIAIRKTVDQSSFIAALRAAGVTRYKRGDVEIELRPGPLDSLLPEENSKRCDDLLRRTGEQEQAIGKLLRGEPIGAEPWAGAFEQLGKAAREAGYLERHPSKAGPHDDDDWRKAWPEEPCTPEERAEREAREGIDEQPPVEIDMAAVDELIKEQDAKRRGQ